MCIRDSHHTHRMVRGRPLRGALNHQRALRNWCILYRALADGTVERRTTILIHARQRPHLDPMRTAAGAYAQVRSGRLRGGQVAHGAHSCRGDGLQAKGIHRVAGEPHGIG